MDRERILAFRLARTGLARRAARSLAEAAVTPASDFARDAALQALAARHDGLTREAYDEAVESGDEIVLAHVVRGAIHALPADDHALFGRALIATDDDELGRQLGQQLQRLAKEGGFAPTDALTEVAKATEAALAGGRALNKNELHEELRQRLRDELLPWCKGCKSNHAPPMLWRFAGVQAGVRLDSERRYVLDAPCGQPAPAEAARRFLHAYGPATAGDFADWAGIARSHADRIWAELQDELSEVKTGRRTAYALATDRADLEDPPAGEGVVLIPPGDPYLQKVNRPLLAPDPELRKRLFRPVASPGAVIGRGRLVGLWSAKTKGRKAEITVEKLGRVARRDLEAEAERIAALRGAGEPVLVID
jgi:Winged helix DNA-binding domain